jgi:transcriptional regulator GlxA family with amidase domain
MDRPTLVRQALAEMPKIPRFPPTSKPVGPLKVEVLAFQAVQLLDVSGPLQVFATANELALAAGRAAPYALRIVSRRGEPVTASAGLVLATAPLPSTRTTVDTLLIAGGPGVHVAAADLVILEWVRSRAARARRTASVCTGAFLLAATGLLHGRRATSHWSHCGELARRYPSIRVEDDPIFINDGSIWTSAGVTAGIDLALALVEQDLGRAAALAVARHLVVFLKRPGGQSQFSAALSLQADDDRFGALHDWIERHLADDISLAVLAVKAGMSERSFSRHYAESTGRTPARAVEQLRVEAARRLLSDTTLPMKRISQRCGFGSEETMRRSFVRLLAVSPQGYRARFGS